MKNELIALAVFLIVTLMFIRTALNNIYPNLFGKLTRLIKVILLLLLKIVVWPITAVIPRIFPFTSPQKKLPGRKI